MTQEGTRTDPLVSVILPCYNHAHYLPEAVASVVAQRMNCWEAVIVDDGSSDDTVAVAQALIATYPERSISLISQPNRGPGASRNMGIAASHAPYVLLLDADDQIDPRCLDRTVPVLDSHPNVGFVTTNVQFFGAEHGAWSGGDPTLERLRYDCRMVPSGTLFRRNAWQQVGGFREQHNTLDYEDWDFWLALVERGWQGRLVPEPLVWYRRNSGGSRFNQSQRNDLMIRARLVASHTTLYPAPFGRWALAALCAQGRKPSTNMLWWCWFGWYASLIARHAPRELPKTLLRPLFKGLDPQQQMYARRVAQHVGLSRKR